MKKVLFVATVVETHIKPFHIPYLKLFKERGWETAVAARNDCGRDEICSIPWCDVFFDIPFERSPLKWANLLAYKKLKHIIETGEYDIIHCHTPVGAVLARLAAIHSRKKGTKVIYTAHGFHFYTGAPLINWMLFYPAEKVLSRWTDVLVTINKEDFERAKRFSAGKTCYVPGVGIDTRRFMVTEEEKCSRRIAMREKLGIPLDATVILSVGELTHRKNHQVIIKAISKISSVNIYYVICGRGPLRRMLEKTSKNEGVGEKVKLMGFCGNIEEYYLMSDIFAFPSKQEGLPVSVIEAMASNLPIISSKIRGSIDLIEDGRNGLLIEDDNADAYAWAIIKCLEQMKCAALGKANRFKAMQYDLSQVVKEYLHIYFQDFE